MESFGQFLDFFTKLLYGSHLTLAFSGVTLKEKKSDYFFIVSIVMLLENSSYFLLGMERTIEIYPFLVHIPLIFLLCTKGKVHLFHSCFSLLLAFQLLSMRVWVGGLVAQCFTNEGVLFPFFVSAVSIPLMLLFSKYLAPSIALLKNDMKMMGLIGIVPISYYIFTYLTQIYSVMSLEDDSYFFQMLDSMAVLMFLTYTVFSLRLFQEKKERELDHAILQNIHAHAETELAQLHRQHEMERMYRHDLRHHGHYLLSRLPEHADQELVDYIKSVMLSDAPASPLLSTHESLNLVLNFYQQEGKKQGISLDIQLEWEDYTGITMVDLCSLLSNGLENAMNACRSLPHGEGHIQLRMSSQGKKLSIDLRNNFLNPPHFQGSLPCRFDHTQGYGTKSMLKICEKYHGITGFSVVGNQFRFQTVLMNQVNAPLP